MKTRFCKLALLYYGFSSQIFVFSLNEYCLACFSSFDFYLHFLVMCSIAIVFFVFPFCCSSLECLLSFKDEIFRKVVLGRFSFMVNDNGIRSCTLGLLFANLFRYWKHLF